MTALKVEPTLTRRAQIGFYTISIVFNMGLIAQLLSVGLAYFDDPAWWNLHVWLVRGYGGLSVILAGWAVIAPFSSKVRGLAVSLPVLLGLQFATIHLPSPLHLAVFHPLVGFLLLYISSSLVHAISRTLAPTHPQIHQI